MHYSTEVEYVTKGDPGAVRSMRTGIEWPSADGTELMFGLWSMLKRMPDTVGTVVSVGGVRFGMTPDEMAVWALPKEAVDCGVGGRWSANRTISPGAFMSRVWRRADLLDVAMTAPAGIDGLFKVGAPASDEVPLWGVPAGMRCFCGSVRTNHPWTGDVTELMPAVLAGRIYRNAELLILGDHVVLGGLPLTAWRVGDQPEMTLGALLTLNHIWTGSVVCGAALDDGWSLLLGQSCTSRKLAQQLTAVRRWSADDPGLRRVTDVDAMMRHLAKLTMGSQYGVQEDVINTRWQDGVVNDMVRAHADDMLPRLRREC